MHSGPVAALAQRTFEIQAAQLQVGFLAWRLHLPAGAPHELQVRHVGPN